MSYRPWGARADLAIIQLARVGDPFTSDDLLHLIGPPDTSHAPNSRNNAVGAAFSRARRAGMIRVVGYAQSKALHRKGGLVRVWQGAE